MKQTHSKQQTRSTPRAATARSNAPSSTHDFLLNLQQSVGNSALAEVVVQRDLKGCAGKLEKTLGRVDRLKGKVRSSALDKIQAALATYLKMPVQDAQRRFAALDRIEELCTTWLKGHGSPKGKPDQLRKAILEETIDEVARARMEDSKRQAQDVYLGNVGAGGPDASGKPKGGFGTDPKTKYALTALSGGGKMAADAGPQLAGQELAAAKGLTEAEVAAIRIFTAADYTYINPATANSASWLAAQKGKAELGLGSHSDKTLKEEGSLHAGVAMQGLGKMDPYTKDTFRGARYTDDEFVKEFAVGKEFSFASFASSAQEDHTALKFAHGIGIEYKIAPEKTVAVMSVLSNTGGRDISELSAVKTEKEVLLLPGSSFLVMSLEEVTDGRFNQYVQTGKKLGQPEPKRTFIARLAPKPKSAAAAKPSAGAPAPSPAGPMPPLPAAPKMPTLPAAPKMPPLPAAPKMPPLPAGPSPVPAAPWAPALPRIPIPAAAAGPKPPVGPPPVSHYASLSGLAGPKPPAPVGEAFARMPIGAASGGPTNAPADLVKRLGLDEF